MMNKKNKKVKDEKGFHFKMPKDTWLLLKKAAVMKEITMGDVVVEFIEKNRTKLTKKFETFGAMEEKEKEEEE